MATKPQTDERLMRRAISLSAGGFPAPNPHVGCVLAHGDTVVGEGFHHHAGGPHAEVVALAQAGPKASGATAYVTLEPCNHHGRTPPCVDALLAAGVKRVVAACADPFKQAAGGLARLSNNGVDTELGLLAEEARRVNIKWLRAVERGMPYIVVKAATTLDGRIATPSGESKWITSEVARAEAHRLRAECGAVLVGRGTAEKDDPALTVRALGVVNQPTRILLDPWRKVPSSLRIFDDSAPTIRVVAGEPRPREIRVGYRSSYLDLHDLLRQLFDQGLTSVLVEGGAHTIGSFMEAGLVDRVELFIAGKVFGAGQPWVAKPFAGEVATATSFAIETLRMVGPDAWLTCYPQRD